MSAWAQRWHWATAQPRLLRFARRGVWAAAGALAGALCVWAGFADLHQDHAALAQAVHNLREAAAAPSPAASHTASQPADAAPPLASAGLARLPGQQDAAGLWLALQKGLQQQGLQVQSLRPQAMQGGGPLASQTLALRLQGRWADWASAWDALVDAGPVWTLDRLSVSANGPSGQLQWDGVWRVWLRPDGPGPEAWPALWDTAERPGSGRAAHHRLPELAMAVGSPDTLPMPAPVSADPRQWPLAQIRLWGVWRDGERQQAVLGAGEHWAVLATGDRLAREGYRVQSIQADALELQSLQRPGEVKVLRLQGVVP
jgi:hypothetical protein